MEAGRGGACVPARVALQGRIGKLLSFITLKQSITRWSSTIRAAPPFLSPNAALRVRQPQEKVAGEVLADGQNRKRLPEEAPPMDKNEEGCVVEGFDRGW